MYQKIKISLPKLWLPYGEVNMMSSPSLLGNHPQTLRRTTKMQTLGLISRKYLYSLIIVSEEGLHKAVKV